MYPGCTSSDITAAEPDRVKVLAQRARSAPKTQPDPGVSWNVFVNRWQVLVEATEVEKENTEDDEQKTPPRLKHVGFYHDYEIAKNAYAAYMNGNMGYLNY